MSNFLEQLAAEVKTLTDKIDDVIRASKELESQGCHVRERKDYRQAVTRLAKYSGVVAGSDSGGVSGGSGSSGRSTAETIAKIDDVISGLLAKAEKGLHIADLKVEFAANEFIKDGGYADKLTARITKLVKDKKVEQVKGKSKREGSTYKVN